MADGMHAVVFVDNHDNQRGHGGNTVLTSQDDPWKYKVWDSSFLGAKWALQITSYTSIRTCVRPLFNKRNVWPHRTIRWKVWDRDFVVVDAIYLYKRPLTPIILLLFFLVHIHSLIHLFYTHNSPIMEQESEFFLNSDRK